MSEPSLCAEGLSVAFWLNFTSGRYVLSSGGQSEFATGFAFFYDKEAAEFVIVLATNMKKWTVKIDAIPQVGYCSTRTSLLYVNLFLRSVTIYTQEYSNIF